VGYEKKLTHFLGNFLPLYRKVLHTLEYGVGKKELQEVELFE
jgi:hypothetical protein